MLFDLDGTIVDDSGLPGALRTACERTAAMVPAVSADALAAANDAEWGELWPQVEDEYMLGLDAASTIVVDAWRGTLARCGVQDAAVLDAAVTAWNEEERRALRPHPDALEALETLRADGLRIGMVTNGASAVQRAKLDAIGLTGAFDPLVISSEVGVRKPDAAIFEHALGVAGVPAPRCWFVGDHLWHDVEAAAAAGLHAVWIDRAGRDLEPSWPQPDLTVAALTDLAAAIRQEPREVE